MPLDDAAFADTEVRAFVDQLDRTASFDEMAAACLDRFGPARAWSRPTMVAYWDVTHPRRQGPTSQIDRDSELKELIDKLIGRFTLDEIRADCVARVGASRAPSRSTIHRYVLRYRRARARETRATPGPVSPASFHSDSGETE
jgi:hypothetical protein